MTGVHPKMTPRELTFVTKPLFCKFASVNADGSPHVTPTWTMYQTGLFVFSIPATAVKIRNIARDGRVALLFDDGYSWVAVKGSATLAIGRDVRVDTENLAVLYMGREEGMKVAAEIVKRKHLSVEVAPESVVSDNV